MAGEMSRRLIAQRFLAEELRQISKEIPKSGGDDFEPQLFLSPTGAKGSRVLFVGVATETDVVGTESVIHRVRVADPTGTAFVSAGQYQPEAAQVLAQLKVPAFVAVVGKISTYTPEEGKILTSIRAERVYIVDETTRDNWLVETVLKTMERMNALKANAALQAEVTAAYPKFVMKDFSEIVKMVVEDMAAPGLIPTSAPQTAPPVTQPMAADAEKIANEHGYTLGQKTENGGKAEKAPEAPKPPAVKPQEKKPEAKPPAEKKAEKPIDPDEEAKNFIKAQLIELDKDGKGIGLNKLAQVCKAHKISSKRMEDLVAVLMDEGDAYEPKIGIIKSSGNTGGEKR
jgi:RPA family protein